jgi:Ca2+-binding RTX toxin-like protein
MQGNDELWGGDGDDLLHGGAGNDLLAGGTGNDTMDGGAGNDTYDVDSTGDTIVEDADEGIDTVRSSIDYAVGGNLENLTLTGTDAVNGAGNAADNVVIGNEGNNTLRGLDGNDMLDGGAGADTLIAGAGDDTYVIDNAGDVVIESAGEGVDTVRSRISTTLGDNVENLTLIGINAINGGGNALDNVIIGNAAANVLDGGAGADQMRGGLGNDTYAVDNAGDLVTEYVNEGVDTVLASVDYALGANLENLTLTGAATQGSGNELDNVIRGNSLTNRLDGGAGADTLVGGTGDDVYVVDDAGDVVVEQANEGIDTAVASVDYALSANVENLTLTGNATLGTANALDNVLTANDLGDALFGNDGNDTLLGGTGTDTLDGGAGNDILIGGAGADLMRGGAGDDSYVVDDAGDQVVETADAGFDRVSSNIDYVLPENVEQLTLTGTALKGTGNALDNLLFGNDQANVFDGAAGADRMVGGAGDDRYIVDNAADQVVETVDAGNDTVLASTSYALAPNVENLVLTGTDALSGTGNELANVLVGNSAANTLSAGDGDDVLAGGQGDDTLGAGNGDDLYLYFQGDGSDVITDASGTDTLRFGPGMTLDSVAGRLITVNGQTRAFISVLGTDGQETSSGVELVPDANGSFPIEQFQFADGTQFSLSDVLISAQTLNGTSSNDTITGARSDDTIYASDGADTVYARWGNDVVHGGNGNDALFGEGGNDKLYGESGNDALWGGAGDDLMDGGIGADQLMGGTGNDTLLGGNDNDVLDGGAGNDNLSGGNGQDELYGGDGNDAMDGGADADLLAAGAGNDSVAGGDGTDVIVAGAGDDTVDGGNLNDSVDAGDGDDVITGGKGTDIIIGGRGNDTYDPGADQDIIAFNRGDGADTFLTSSNQSDTLSLGGGIRYADLSLSKVGTNLVLNLGSDESITFKDWYLDGTRRNIATLQMITAAAGGDYNPSSSDRMLNSKAVTFDFAKLVNNFGKALAADPSLTTWPLARQLNAAYVKGSNTQAIGGDLAYRYATMGNYGDLTWQAVSTRLASTSGSGWQTLAAPSSTVNPWTALQAGISLIADQTVGLPTPITPHATVSADDLAFAALSAGSVKPSWLQTPHAVGP